MSERVSAGSRQTDHGLDGEVSVEEAHAGGHDGILRLGLVEGGDLSRSLLLGLIPVSSLVLSEGREDVKGPLARDGNEKCVSRRHSGKGGLGLGWVRVVGLCVWVGDGLRCCEGVRSKNSGRWREMEEVEKETVLLEGDVPDFSGQARVQPCLR